jgi:F-type H+-transporting ATPase subunit b
MEKDTSTANTVAEQVASPDALEAVNHAVTADHSNWMHEPKIWLALAFATLIVLFGGKVKRAIGKMLDARAIKIANELEQASALRAEAEALKESYQQKLRESVKEAESIIEDARAQASRMVTNAEAEIKEMMERRMQQMIERINQQELHAFDEVRDHVVDITIAAAKSLIIQHFETISSDQMVRHVLADLDRKVH